MFAAFEFKYLINYFTKLKKDDKEICRCYFPSPSISRAFYASFVCCLGYYPVSGIYALHIQVPLCLRLFIIRDFIPTISHFFLTK